ncbi:hypothetical protein ACHAXS_004799 [Conticribra weissflogii]
MNHRKLANLGHHEVLMHGYRTSAKAKFYPTHCTIPQETPMDTAVCTAKELALAIQKLTTAAPSKLS